MSLSKSLVIFAHPNLQKSNIHRTLIESIQQIEYCHIQDLYELYPKLFIDVDVEQSLLKKHDVIVLQFPLLWFSMPALLKQWFDSVFVSEFANGKKGTHLQGKKLICLVSAGASEDTYNQRENGAFNIKELFAPIEQTARYCAMEYLPPYVIYDANNQTRADIAKHESNLFWLFEHVHLADHKSLSDQIEINHWVESKQTEKK